MSCSIATTVSFPFSRPTSAASRCTPSEPRPDVGSSRQSTRGLCAALSISEILATPLSEALRGVQREIRDEFTERTAELQRTYTDAARQATEAAQRGAADAKQRVGQVEAALAALGSATSSLTAALAVVDR